jgi:hypothetical protein
MYSLTQTVLGKEYKLRTSSLSLQFAITSYHLCPNILNTPFSKLISLLALFCLFSVSSSKDRSVSEICQILSKTQLQYTMLRPYGKNWVGITKDTWNMTLHIINKHKNTFVGVCKEDAGIPGWKFTKELNELLGADREDLEQKEYTRDPHCHVEGLPQ